MATVIDKFLISLGLDTRDYDDKSAKAQKSLEKFGKASDAQAKAIAEQGKVMGDGFNRVKQEILSMTAAALGSRGMVDFIKTVTAGQAALAQKSRDFGESAKTIDIVGHAFKRLGGSADGVQSLFQSIHGAIVDASMGKNSPVIDSLNALGVTVMDATGKTRGMVDIINDLNRAFNDTRYSEQEKIRLSQMLSADPNTANVLRRSVAEYQAAMAAAQKHASVTDQSSEAARRLATAWAALGDDFSIVGERIFANAIPALETLTKEVDRALEKFLELDKKAGGAASTAIGIGSAAAAGGASIWTGSKILKLFSGAPSQAAPAVAEAATAAAPGASAATAGGGLLALLSKLGPWMTGIGLGLHHEALNAGEDQELAKRWAGLDGKKAAGAQGVTNPAPAGSKAILEGAEKKYGLPTGMLDRIWSIESSRGKNMVSPKGATGHFGFMPKTAAEYGMTREDTFDLAKSAEAAAKLLSSLLAKYGGDVPKALAGYNWGQGNLDRLGTNQMPQETRDYIAKYRAMSERDGSQAELVKALDALRKVMEPLSLQKTPVTPASFVGAAGGQAQYFAQMSWMARPQPANLHTHNVSNSNSSETHIATLVVNSSAKDATGIASDIQQELKANDRLWGNRRNMV